MAVGVLNNKFEDHFGPLLELNETGPLGRIADFGVTISYICNDDN